MSSTPESWTVRHFSQANPKGPGCDSVPALLRRLADSIEALGPVEIQDVVIQSERTEFGSDPTRLSNGMVIEWLTKRWPAA